MLPLINAGSEEGKISKLIAAETLSQYVLFGLESQEFSCFCVVYRVVCLLETLQQPLWPVAGQRPRTSASRHVCKQSIFIKVQLLTGHCLQLITAPETLGIIDTNVA